MAPPTRTPRGKWIEEGLRALAAGGPDAVRIDTLAKTLDVTRGGFYWHFADRRALLEEMLDTWERRSTNEVIDRVESEGGDPRTKARRAGALTFPSPLPARLLGGHRPPLRRRRSPRTHPHRSARPRHQASLHLGPMAPP